jgi:hypothetical protein
MTRQSGVNRTPTDTPHALGWQPFGAWSDIAGVLHLGIA